MPCNAFTQRALSPLGWAVAAVLALGLAPQAHSDPQVPPAVQELRRHMLDASTNSLTFHSMDQLFYTREVTRTGFVWALPKREAPLDFRYTAGGSSHTPEEFLDRTYTNALIILKHGTVVYENYRNLTNDRTRFISFSMAKSFTSVLIGIALAEGKIHSLDDKIGQYVPELKPSGYGDVSIRDVMRMRSGVAYDERYDFGVKSQAQQDFEEALVENIRRFADTAVKLKRVQPPGKAYNYSTMDTAVLGWMLERAVKQPIATYMSSKLWEPLGVEADGFWIADGEPGVGRELNGMGFNAVARDYARFGQMLLQNGSVKGRQIVPKEWVEESTASTPIGGPFEHAAVPLGYGYQWWTLHGTGAYTALGLQGQFVYVDPRTETVVVKLSYFPPGDNTALEDESLLFFRAVSAWNP
jgi:CubicO group peptidase (beta-lactamase class C family)